MTVNVFIIAVELPPCPKCGCADLRVNDENLAAAVTAGRAPAYHVTCSRAALTEQCDYRDVPLEQHRAGGITDTQRLDWLARTGCSVESTGETPETWDVWRYPPPGDPRLVVTGKTAREAIDAAMLAH